MANLTADSSNSWLDKSSTVAKPGFNRWLVPPAALAIHLCIGMSYGLSLFLLAVRKAISVAPDPSCKTMTLADSLFTTNCNWRVSDLLFTFTIGIVVLGLSAAL